MVATSVELDGVGKIAGVFITIALFVWGIVRVLMRPYLDDSRWESWKRKASDAEKFMRDGMFKKDFDERAEIRQLASQGLQLANMNAQAISALTADIGRVANAQASMGSLLHSLPHLAGSMEQIATGQDAMREDIRVLSGIARDNGEVLAAHSALLGTDRRYHARRATDRPDDSGPELRALTPGDEQ